MKLFVWTDMVSYLAVAHAESMAQAREMLVSEICGWDGSCPERTKARLDVEQKGAEIWRGPVAHFAVMDSEMLRQAEAENARLRAALEGIAMVGVTLSNGFGGSLYMDDGTWLDPNHAEAIRDARKALGKEGE